MTREEIGKLADIVIQNTRISAALEKQKPKKPTNQYPMDFGLGNYGDCRICNQGVDYQQNYCDNCGQKLDWSKDE